MTFDFKKTLVIAPHLDDETIALGGTIKKLSKAKIKINVIIVGGHLPPLYNEKNYLITKEESEKALKILGIKHDIFVHESQLIKNNFVEKTVDELKNNKLVYEGYLEPPKGELNKSWKPRKQLLFNSKRFGDDSDRALKKEDGTWTYFASDIAYHAHKVQRKFHVLINILGADHAGYIKRITSATSAVSIEKTNNRIDLKQVLLDLAKREANEVHVEAGSNICGSLLKEKLVDEIVIYMAPNIMGNNTKGLFDIPELTKMEDKINMNIIDTRKIGSDIRITMSPIYD